jgi:hypothetical protein
MLHQKSTSQIPEHPEPSAVSPGALGAGILGVHLPALVARKNKSELPSPEQDRAPRYFLNSGSQYPAQHGGQIAVTGTEDLKERWEQLLRYCAMERESTDPLALGLLHDIVLELQADLQAVSAGAQFVDAQ